MALTAILTSSVAASAAEVDAVTGIATSPASVLKGESISVTANFTAPASAVNGDTFTINYGSHVKGETLTLPIKDAGGNVIANCTSAAKAMTCTFTNYVDTHSDVTGTFTFPVIGDTETSGAGLDWTTGSGTSFHTNTEIAPPNPFKPGALYKLHTINPDGSVTYRVGLSGLHLATDGYVIHDQYDPSTVLNKPSITMVTASTTTPPPWTPVDPSGYTVSFDDATHSFTVTVSPAAISADSDHEYWVLYTVMPDSSVQSGDDITNTATAGTEKATHTFQFSGVNGVGDGKIGSVSWGKVDDSGNHLSGATFTLSGPNGYSEQIADNSTLDQDKTDGKFSVGSLDKGTYTLSETVAPVGYQLVTKTWTVTLAAGGGMTQSFGDIVNTKTPAPSPTPTPTVTPTPAPTNTSTPAPVPAGASVNTGGTAHIGSENSAGWIALALGILALGGVVTTVTLTRPRNHA